MNGRQISRTPERPKKKRKKNENIMPSGLRHLTLALGLLAAVASLASASSIRITNSVHGECDVSPSSSGTACWMGGTSFSLRYFQDPAGETMPTYLHVGWNGGRSAYHFIIARDAVTSSGKWCYSLAMSTTEALYGEQIRVTKDGDVYSNAHEGRCTLANAQKGAPKCCTLQSVTYCVHQTGSPMSWGGEYLSATWGSGSFKVALVPLGDGGESRAELGCIGCGEPRNETTCIGNF
jgi:hypothetical protein